MKLSRVIVISLFMVTAVLLGLRTQKRAVPVPRSEAQTSKAGSEPGISNHAVTTSVPQLSTRQPVRGPGRLGEWMEKYVNATSADERAKLLGEGESVARARRLVLKNLIQQDPEAALQMAIPYGVRKQLPVSIKALLEEPISARGKISLIESSPAPGEEEVPEAWYKAEIDHKVFHVYGSGLKTRRSINGFALMGIAVDDVMALYSAPPILDDAQVADLVQQGRLPMESICSVSGQAASNPTVVDIGGTYKPFCTVSHAQAFQQEYVAASAISEATSAATLNAVSALSSTDLPTTCAIESGFHHT